MGEELKKGQRMKFRYFRTYFIIFCHLYGEIQKYVHILKCFFHLGNSSLMGMDPETFPKKKRKRIHNKTAGEKETIFGRKWRGNERGNIFRT
jgi:hypothetical protein